MNEVKTIPKPTYKRRSRKKEHDFSAEVKRKEYEEAKGICRICQCRPITQYHHANEKGMGGGRGLGIQINCIGLCDICHNHDITENLDRARDILRHRVEKLFNGEEKFFSTLLIAKKVGLDNDEMYRQSKLGFLKVYGSLYAEYEDICRWLGVA